jgi:hypothetical protein
VECEEVVPMGGRQLDGSPSKAEIHLNDLVRTLTYNLGDA